MSSKLCISRAGIAKLLFVFAFFATGLEQVSTAQTPAAPVARQLGTVKAIAGSTITLAPDNGQPVTVTLTDAVKVVQLPAGSTDLKAATAAAVSDIAVGDRILASGQPGGAPGQLTATRVVLMKSSDIAKRRAQEQADWQKRGSGGLVTAVDPAGTLTITAGAKKIQVTTSSATVYRRYSGDSIKFEDAVPGTLAEIHVGDQLRVRGAKSDDGSSIQAEEIVSGSFANVSGVIATLDATSGTITLKDLATKKMMTIKVTANSDLRNLPDRAAQMFAARAKGGAAGASGAPAADNAGGSGAPRGPGGGPGGGGAGGGGRSAGMDLSQMLGRLPTQTIADLKVGEAVMIVASVPAPASTKVTAITLLTGVEPILAAAPTGAPMELSPWNMGGAPDAGGGQ